jgi:hypothetical protein
MWGRGNVTAYTAGDLTAPNTCSVEHPNDHAVLFTKRARDESANERTDIGNDKCTNRRAERDSLSLAQCDIHPISVTVANVDLWRSTDHHPRSTQMKRFALLLICALTACGGGGSSTVPQTPAAGGTGSTTMTLLIPTTALQRVQANARNLQYISQSVYQFFFANDVDHSFDTSVSLTQMTCGPANSGGLSQCTSPPIAFPTGVVHISILALSNGRGLNNSQSPVALGYTKFTQTIKPGQVGSNAPLTVILTAIDGGGVMDSDAYLGYGALGPTPPPPAEPYPYVTVALDDAANAPISFPAPGSGFQLTYLLNPLTVSTDDSTGHIVLGRRTNAGNGQPDSLYTGPDALVNLTTLTSIDGFEIIDSLPAGQHSIFTISLASQSVTILATEFPMISQFHTLPNGPPYTSLTVQGIGVGEKIDCGPLTHTSVSPCVHAN